MKRLFVLLALASCSSNSGNSAKDGAPSGSPDAQVPEDQTIVGMDGEHVFFGNENRRTVDVPVVFPEPGNYDQIIMYFALRCPDNRCDWWDRIGWISIVENPGEETETEYELSRFITPYRVGAAWNVNVTDLMPILQGETTLRVFIDTWVGPGHANGDGWLVDASFDFHGGVPSPRPTQVIPIFPTLSFVYGDPAAPEAREVSVDVPADAQAARLRTFITGHGQGNADNCAEFCSRDHTLTVNGQSFNKSIWRDDCVETAAPNQQGTWTYSRAGWCPGAVVHDWLENVSDPVEPGTTVTVGYEVEAWENSCRPDAEPCSGCVAGDCNYNSNGHTEPRFYLSSYLIVYQ